MIETITYSKDLKVIVFDEPIPEYHNIILSAASDNHRLSKNYRADVLKTMEFMCVWVLDDNPKIIYGVQRDNNLPNNVARAFSRYFLIPNCRRAVAPRTNDTVARAYDFYSVHPEFHQRIGIDTLFFTRNLRGGSKGRHMTQAAAQYGYKEVEEPRMYRGCPQYFWVLGDSTFVESLPVYSSEHSDQIV